MVYAQRTRFVSGMGRNFEVERRYPQVILQRSLEAQSPWMKESI